MPRQASSDKRLIAVLGLWIVAVCALTLRPGGPTRPFSSETFLCLWCGRTATTDVILNWALFVPGGVLLALLTGGRRAILAGLALSALVETCQVGIPSRDPALQDLLANGLGAATGFAVVRRGLDGYVRSTLVAVAAIVWLSPALLLRPTVAGTALLTEWTPAERVGQYDGELLDAHVAGVAAPPELVPTPTALDEAVARRSRIELSLLVGSAPEVRLTIFRVTDIHAHDIVNVGIVGHDILLRGKSIAVDALLNRPASRWSGALIGASPGDSVDVVIERARGSVCMSAGNRSACGLAPPLSAGWSFLMVFDEAPAWARTLLGLGWALGIGCLIGIGSSRCSTALASAIAVGAAGFILAVSGPDVAPEIAGPVLLPLGSLAGHALKRRVAGEADRV